LPQNVFSAQVNKSPESEIIESTLLWEAPIDEVTWEPLKLKELLKDTTQFSPSGNFYKVNYDLYVFGHKAIYLGMRGIDFVPGPNATLEGNPEAISKNISENYNITFTKNEDEYVADLKEYIKLVIAPHPNLKDTSLVIGAYLGP